MSERIQRKRTKGWRMPEGAVYVGRPTKWGNPYDWRTYPALAAGFGADDGEPTRVSDAQRRRFSVVDFRSVCVHEIGSFQYPTRDEIRAELAGRDLACWCPLDQPCHADVLLEIANANGDNQGGHPMTAPQPSDTPRADQWADKPWPVDSWPTPEQWVTWFVGRTTEFQRELAENIIRNAQTAGRCFIANHEAEVDRLRAALAEAEAHARTAWAVHREHVDTTGVIIARHAGDATFATIRAEQAERERDEAHAAGWNDARAELLPMLDTERGWMQSWRSQSLMWEARAEQAERQSRELPEQIAQAIEALGVPDDVAADGPSTSEAYVFHHTKARAARIARAALSGVSGPTTGRAHSLTDCWCGEQHRREDFL